MKKSIVVDYDGICAICGRPRECDHHLVYGVSLRRLADEDGLTIPMCNRCHNLADNLLERIHGNSMAEKLSKIVGELAWERYKLAEELAAIKGDTPERIIDLTQTKFMARYGRSYI